MSIKQVIVWETSEGKTFTTEKEAYESDIMSCFQKVVNEHVHLEEFDFEGFLKTLKKNKELTETFIKFLRGEL